MKSLNYEVLKGDKKGTSSIRVNDQYRIEFSVTLINDDSIVTICNILDLTNHYKSKRRQLSLTPFLYTNPKKVILI